MALLLAAPPAFAQGAPERELTPDERARELYLRGDRLYAEGSYDEAIVALQEAYDLSRRPALLYDIANALERLGRYEEALRYLNDYAPSAPEHQRHIVLKRIRSLELRAEERRRQEGAAAQAAPPQPAPVSRPALEAPPALVLADEPEASPPILGYVLGGVGLVGIGVGVVLGLSANGARNDAEGQCVDNGTNVLCPASVRDQLDDSKNRAIAADVAWGLGAVALGVGLYLVLDANAETGSTTQLRSAATPGGVGVNLVQSF